VTNVIVIPVQVKEIRYYNNKAKDADKTSAEKVWGDPEYGPEGDIYAQDKKLQLEVQGNITEDDSNETISTDSNVPDAFSEEQERVTGKDDRGDLDIPGSELDDADELIGEEDEENNYYSLGGDNHEDLEEDRS